MIPKQLQWVWLLIFSYIFYLASGGGGSVHPDHYRHYLSGRAVAGAHGPRSGLRPGPNSGARSDRLRRPANPQQPLSPDEKKALKARFKQRKKWITALVLFVSFGILAALKYRNFAADNMNLLFTHFSSAKLLLPLGISFYTFSPWATSSTYTEVNTRLPQSVPFCPLCLLLPPDSPGAHWP